MVRVNSINRSRIANEKSVGKKEAYRSGFTFNDDTTRLLIARSRLAGRAMDDPRRDINAECGYPEDSELNCQVYREWYEREGLASRVVNVYPDECWSVYPDLCENEKEETTPFEEAWAELNSDIPCWHYLHRVDVLSGIGSFGVIFLGLDDGRKMDSPVLNDRGERPKNARALKLLYLRVFDESLVRVLEWETNEFSPRCGQPTLYAIKFADPREQAESQPAPTDLTEKAVHWSRIVHIADNRIANELFGIPRMKNVANRLYDCRKILGGSAEMFWRGAQPGWAFSADNENGEEVEFDADSLKEQWEAYSNGLQRYLALIGMKAQSLAPQIADPSSHLLQHLQAIAATIGVPLPVFLGQIEGHMAGAQNAMWWNRRLARRQKNYVHPMIIQPFVKRLIALGVMPKVKSFYTEWTDLNAISEADKADIALKRAQALLQYVTSGAESIMPVTEFFTMIMGLTIKQANAVKKAAAGQTQMTKKVWMKDQIAAGNPNNTGKGKVSTSRPARNSLGKAK